MKTEKELEQMLVRAVKVAGGKCYKFTSPSETGVPDRIVVLNGQVVFVETKSEYKHRRVRKKQAHVHEELKALGAKVYIIKSEEEIGELLNELRKN